MKRRLFMSFLIIALVAAAITGGTLAWFTDQAVTENVFTAGTLVITAVDNWQGLLPGEDWENANPGDCIPKVFTITNDGSKNMYVRFAQTGGWEAPLPNPRGVDPIPPGTPDDDLVAVTPAAAFADQWTLLGGYWYYNGVLPPFDEDNPTDHILEFTFNVCLNGPNTGDVYQGATYELEFTFDAIQATHFASFDAWTAGYYVATPASEGWYVVVPDGDDWEMTVGVNVLTWVPTAVAVPNYLGWPELP